MPTIQLKRGLFAGIPVLADGEPGWTTDTHQLFVGQGGTNYEVGGSGSLISDVAYDATTWDAVTTIAPSKNAVRDLWETLGTMAFQAAADYTPTAGLGALAFANNSSGVTYDPTISGLTATDVKAALDEIVATTGAGDVVSVVAGTNITVDNTDPANPIVSSTGGGSGTVTNAANLADNFLVLGDGGTVGVKTDSSALSDGAGNLSGVVSIRIALDGLHAKDPGGFYLILTGASNSELTADRILRFRVQNANRIVTLSGNITVANDFITSGAFSLTLTTTAATNVTLPTSGTLATTADVAAVVSDTAYDATSWNAVTTIAPSKNAVRDWIEAHLADANPHPGYLTPTEGDAAYSPLAHTHTFASLTSKPTTLAGYGITDAQALDADLTAIAALAGTSGFLKKTAADTWTLDTSTYLTAAAADALFLTPAEGDAAYQPLDADLTALAALSGTNTIYYRSAANTWTAVTIGTGLTFSAGTLAASGGDALTTNPLSQFAATTSLQLKGVISDETGSGALVFADSPALAGTPTAPTAAPLTNTTQIATTAYVEAAVAAGAGGTPANPTASVGLTAVNGAATTYMRSDAAPPIDQGIQPTWTAYHRWTFDASGAAGTMGYWESTSAGADGVVLWCVANSASPAANDKLLTFHVEGKNDVGTLTYYGDLYLEIVDPTSTSEDSQWALRTKIGGFVNTAIQIAAGVYVGAPTGGDKGAGTLNAVTLYQNGTALSSLFLAIGGNAVTATSAATLTTPRQINGVNFNGSANITITAAAGTLTGTTLASNVTASSLLSAAGGSFGTAAFTAATDYQPIDADLTAIAALAGTSGFLTKTAANTWALDTSTYLTAAAADALFLTPAEGDAAYQPLDADLTTWAGLTPSANAQSLVTAANYAAMRALLDLEAGTDFYSISAADTLLAAKAPLASPTFTGTPAAPTATAGTNTTQIATTAFVNTAAAAIPANFRGVLWGLVLSNDATDPTNDIDIAVGAAAADDGTAFMALGSALVKRLDAAWTVGTNQGGLDTGTIANDWYHVWLIQRSDTGVVDVLFSASATAPTMPTSYDRKCWIGAILRASATIVPFTQIGNQFIWETPRTDIDVSNQGTSATARTLSAPDGISTLVEGQGNAGHNTLIVCVEFRQTMQADQAPSLNANPFSTIRCVVAGQAATGGTMILRTDTSGQITTRSDQTSTFIRFATKSWFATER